MKMVLAVIQPFKLDDVVLALGELPRPPGMTVSEARGYGWEHALGEHGRAEELRDFTPCVRVEVVVDDADAQSVVGALRRAAHTGRRGDGHVWVQPIEASFSVRTLEGREERPVRER